MSSAVRPARDIRLPVHVSTWTHERTRTKQYRTLRRTRCVEDYVLATALHQRYSADESECYWRLRDRRTATVDDDCNLYILRLCTCSTRPLYSG
jgi:hypothetical protein